MTSGLTLIAWVERRRRGHARADAEDEHRGDREQHAEMPREHRAQEDERRQHAQKIGPDGQAVDRQARE